MALSDAKKAADKRHVSKLDNIMIRPYKEEGAAIRAAAAAAGQSVQAYVLQAIRERMARDAAGIQAPPEAPQVPIQPPEQAEEPEFGTAEWYEWRRAKNRQSEAEREGGSAEGGVSILNGGGEEASVSSCPVSHTETVLERPEDLPDAKWAEWAHRTDGESDDEWRKRIDSSLPKGIREMGRRLELLSNEELMLYKENDPKSVAKREEEKQKRLARYDELVAMKKAKGEMFSSADYDELKRLSKDLSYELAKRDGRLEEYIAEKRR